MVARRRVPAIIAAVFVVVAAAGSYVVWPRDATPVTEQEALESYRSRDTTPEAQLDDTTGSATLPAPGVYSYTASGQEVVKLGPLPAETRPYPDTMTVVIVGDEPSCFTATLNLLDQHTEDTTYCLDDTGHLRIDGHNKHQQIGALNPSAAMTCDPDVLISPGANDRDLTCTLSLSGGPAQLSATLAGSAHTAKPTTATVGDSEVDAIAVDVTYQITGDLTGTWREQLWFAQDNWLPLRIERNLDLRGLATFTEQSTLNLTDTTPTK